MCTYACMYDGKVRLVVSGIVCWVCVGLRTFCARGEWGWPTAYILFAPRRLYLPNYESTRLASIHLAYGRGGTDSNAVPVQSVRVLCVSEMFQTHRGSEINTNRLSRTPSVNQMIRGNIREKMSNVDAHDGARPQSPFPPFPDVVKSAVKAASCALCSHAGVAHRHSVRPPRRRGLAGVEAARRRERGRPFPHHLKRAVQRPMTSPWQTSSALNSLPSRVR